MGDLYALSNQGDATRNCACQQKSMIYTMNLWETKTFKKKKTVQAIQVPRMLGERFNFDCDF